VNPKPTSSKSLPKAKTNACLPEITQARRDQGACGLRA
jgi:hypothetical protein